MHKLQKKILDLAESGRLEQVSLRQIGRYLGEKHPQQVKHHLLQLEKQGRISLTREQGKLNVSPVLLESNDGSLLMIPVVGSANCGPSLNFADERIEEYLPVSKKLLPNQRVDFAIRAEGNSMNAADVNGNSIDDGDYVLINKQITRPENGDYVLSVIDDVANIKKFQLDRKNGQIILSSESRSKFPPIYISSEDEPKYFVNGKVVAVLKKPKLE